MTSSTNRLVFTKFTNLQEDILSIGRMSGNRLNGINLEQNIQATAQKVDKELQNSFKKKDLTDEQYQELIKLFHKNLNLAFPGQELTIIQSYKSLSNAFKEPDNTPQITALSNEPKFQKASETEQNFTKSITAKNVGHFAGDALLEGLRDEKGFPLEGNTPSTSMTFFNNALKFLAEKYPEKFSKDLCPSFEEAISLAHEIEKGRGLTTIESLSTALERVSKLVVDKLSQKEIGETLLIPIGWSTRNASGHAMLMEIKKGRNGILDVRVFNTGSGAGYHDPAQDKVNTLKRYSIPESDFKNKISSLLEPKMIAWCDDVMKDSNEFSAADIYDQLAEYEVKLTVDDQNIVAAMKLQKSGTCSMRCLLAYYLSKVGTKNYKEFKSTLEKEIADITIQKYPHIFLKGDAALGGILSNILPNFFRQIEKKRKETITQADLNELEGLQELFNTEFPKSSSSKIALDVAPSFPDQSSKIKSKLQDLKNYTYPDLNNVSNSKFQKTDNLYSPKYLDKPDLSGKELLESMRSFKSTVNIYKTKNTVGVNEITYDYLIHLGRIFTDPAHSNQRKHLLQTLSKDESLCRELIDTALELAKGMEDSGCEMNFLRTLAYQSAICTVWELGVLLDNKLGYKDTRRLDRYGIIPPDFVLLKNNEDYAPTFLNPTMENDFENLVNYFESKGNSRSLEFTVKKSHSSSSESNENFFYIDGAELFYSKAFGENLSAEDKATADDEYKMQKFKGNVTIDQWRGYWCYVNRRLPEHFLKLRELCFLSHTDSLFKFSPGQHGKDIKLSNLQISPSFSPEIVFLVSANDHQIQQSSPGNLHKRYYGYFTYNFKGSIDSFDQNPQIITSRSAQIKTYANNSKEGLQYIHLMDRFRQSLQDFQNPIHRVFFWATLFQPGNLKVALKGYPELQQELLNFINEAIAYYDLQSTESIDLKTRVDTIAFLLEQKQRFLNYSISLGFNSAREELLETRKTIRESLQKTDYNQFPEVKEHLLLTLIDSYSSVEKLTKDELKEVLHTQAQIGNLNSEYVQNRNIPNGLRYSVSSILAKHAFEIQTLIKEGKNSDLFYDILNLFEPDPNIQFTRSWEDGGFPFVLIRHKSDIYSLNLLLGIAYKNGIPLKTHPGNITDQASFVELFGKEPIRGVIRGNLFEGSDQIGKIYQKIEFHSSPAREILNEICINIPIDQLKDTLPPFENLDRLQAWKSKDTEFIALIDPKLKKIVYFIDKEGLISFPSDRNKKYSWVDLEKVEGGKGIKEFNQKAILLQNKEEKILLLPGYKDELGQPIAFEEKVIRPEGKAPFTAWVWKKNPNLYISPEQKIDGIRNFKKFLVLESVKGEKEALFLIDKQSATEGRIGRFKMAGNSIAYQSQAVKNYFYAYLQMMHARTPEDYHRAFDFIKTTKKFARLNEEEVRFLDWIVFPDEHRKDGHPDAAAIRVLAAAKIMENYRAYPDTSSKKIDPKNKLNNWTDYAQRGFEGNILEKILKESFDKSSNTQNDLKVTSWIDIDQLFSWGVYSLLTNNPTSQKSEYKIFDPLPSSKISETIKSVNELHQYKAQYQKYPPFFTRLPTDKLQYFTYLYDEAKSTDPIRRERLLNFLKNSLAGKHGNDPNQQLMEIILWAAYYSNESDESLQPLAKKATEVINQMLAEKNIETPSPNLTLDNFYDLFKPLKQPSNVFDIKSQKADFSKPPPKDTPEDVLNRFWLAFCNRRNPPRPISWGFLEVEKKPNALPKNMQFKLPESVPPVQYIYKPDEGSFNTWQILHSDLFEIPDYPADLKPPHEFKCPEGAKDFVKNKVKEMNEDYVEGFKRNWKTRNTRFKKPPKTIAAELISKRNEYLLEKQKDEGPLGNLHIMRQQIVKDANAVLDSQPKLKVQVKGYKKSKLTYEDCETLFLQGDLKKLQDRGNLSAEQAKDIFDQIGKYLEKQVYNDQRNEIIESINEIEKALNHPKILDQCLRKTGELLGMKHAIHALANPGAALVFERKNQKRFRDHQIDGLNDLLSSIGKPKNIFVQRIQAGGKSVMWSPTLAQYKADGYHLSVHVTPVHQYQSTLSDMGERSYETYQQRQRTLIFDDSPAYFTEEHLQEMKTKMTVSILNKDYINTTFDTLRAMRTKYLKTGLDIVFNPNKLSPEKIDELRKKNALLLDVLEILRKRGVFTFDELHQAMDPHNVLNMPYGQIVHPEMIQCELVSTILLLAAQSKQLLNLKENRQSQQTEEQKAEMKVAVVKGLLSNELWLERFGVKNKQGTIDKAKLKKLEDYFQTPNADLPEFLSSKKEEGIDPQLAILVHQLIADNWLTDSLKENVLESYGIHHKADGPPIAIPFLANLVPIEGSEYSDRYVSILKTLISYQIEGITESQAVQYIELLRKRALQEFEDTKVDNPSFKYSETKAYKEFQAVVGMELSKVDPGNANHLELVRNSLKKSDPAAMQSLNDFVIALVLTQIELYNTQVSTNAQATATMAKVVDGFSATLDVGEVAPIMDIKGTTVEIKKDFGTNGQTIDLLLRENNEVHVVSSDPLAIFRMINSLDEQKKSRVRAIIDIGCHFRGKKSHEVAKMYLDQVHNDKVTTVLFFDEKSGKLHYIKKDNPGVILEAHNIEISKLLEEIGCSSEEEVFGIFDQFRITATNLKFSRYAIGIKTFSEQTVEDSELQGGRRMRSLDDFQNVITTVQQGSLDKIGNVLGNEKLKHFELGEVKDPDTIHDLLLYSKMKSADTQMPMLFSICMQKMTNLAEQYILDSIMKNRNNEEWIIRQTGEIFAQSSFIDLVKEYSKKKVECDMSIFLGNLKAYYLDVIRRIDPSAEEWKSLNELYDKVISEFSEKLEKKILVRPDQTTPATIQPLSGNRDATVNHIRSQESIDKRKAQEDQQNIEEQRNIQDLYGAKITPHHEDFIREDIFLSESFLREPNERFPHLQSLMNDSSSLNKFSHLISEQFITSINFTRTVSENTNLVDTYRKPVEHILLVCDTDPITEKNTWRMVLCSVKDAEEYIKYLSSGHRLPMNRRMWMMRPQGDRLWKTDQRFSKAKITGDPEVRKLLLQSLFWGGNIYYLSRKPWRDDFAAWIKSMSPADRLLLKELFEKHILRGPSLTAYRASTLPTLF